MFDESKKIIDPKEKKAFIEFIQFCHSNRPLLGDIRERINRLTPFVGAGLSCDFNFPNWTNFFKEMCNNHLPTGEACDEINSILIKIKNNEKPEYSEGTFYTRMADLAAGALGVGFWSYLEQIFDKNIDKEKVKKSAAYEVAKIFKGLCLTTNFDRIMETAYALTGRTNVFSPGEEEKIRQHNLRKTRNDFLFHLHGSVKDACSNPERIVLTTESYKEFYTHSYENNFLKTLEGEIIFYLGIGLENEEPFLAFFKNKLPSDGHFYHFAIYYAETKKDAEILHKNLEKQQIRALIYPKGKYDYVKYILDWLQKENPTLNEIEQWKKDLLDNFDWPILSYVDEPKNLSKLGEFLDDKYPIRYAEISGGCWSGKTRLAEELKKKAESKNWDVRLFDEESFYSYSLTSLPNTNSSYILYIFDDSTTYTLDEDEKNKFFKYLIDSTKKKKKIRIVFLYKSSGNPKKWWEDSIKANFGFSPEIYFWREIVVDFSEKIAEEIIYSFFAEEHENMTEKIDEKKIKNCFKFWKKLVANKEIPFDAQTIMNTPQGCMLMASAWMSNATNMEEIICKIRRSLIKVGLSKSDVDKILIWIKKYKELSDLIIIPGESIGTNYASPPTTMIADIGLNKGE